MINIDVIGEVQALPDKCIQSIKELIVYTLQTEQIHQSVEISVNFVTNRDIQKLNKQFRKIDSPTDVLSFPLHDRKELENTFSVHPISLGDIVISIDQAIEQAKAYNHSLEREYAFLTLHGLLHLLGYDHDTEENERIMFAKQKKLLKEFGLERS